MMLATADPTTQSRTSPARGFGSHLGNAIATTRCSPNSQMNPTATGTTAPMAGVKPPGAAWLMPKLRPAPVSP